MDDATALATLDRFTKYLKPGDVRCSFDEVRELRYRGWVRWSEDDARYVLTDEGQHAYLRK